MNTAVRNALINSIKFLESVAALYPAGIVRQSKLSVASANKSTKKLVFVTNSLESADKEIFQAIVRQGLKLNDADCVLIDLSQTSLDLAGRLQQVNLSSDSVRATIFLDVELKNVAGPSIALPGLAQIRADAKIKKDFWVSLKNFVESV